jgi:hypothetical protein
MGDNSFLGRIFYKKKYKGKVERDGKVYLKYSKKRRLDFPGMNAAIVLLIIILLVVVYLFVSNLVIGRK